MTGVRFRKHLPETPRPLARHNCHRPDRPESPRPLTRHNCHRPDRPESPRPLDRPRLAAVLLASLVRSLRPRGRSSGRPLSFPPWGWTDQRTPGDGWIGAPLEMDGPAHPWGWTGRRTPRDGQISAPRHGPRQPHPPQPIRSLRSLIPRTRVPRARATAIGYRFENRLSVREENPNERSLYSFSPAPRALSPTGSRPSMNSWPPM